MLDEQELWDQYRQRQREIRQQIASLQDEEAKLFRATLQRIQDINPSQNHEPKHAGTLDSHAQTAQERKNDCAIISEDDTEAGIARTNNYYPNCS